MFTLTSTALPLSVEKKKAVRNHVVADGLRQRVVSVPD
jgi:hypothetical protein